jgi:hypothetical protein
LNRDRGGVNWAVGVAEHRRDELAENELLARGFGVHCPRQWQRERTLRGKMKTTYDLLLSPYFFLQFDLSDKEQYALVKQLRGVSHVLETRPEIPGVIPAALIAEHCTRENAERANLAVPRAKGRHDLVLLNPYVIVRHELFKGQVGKLVGVSGGLAILDHDRGIIKVPENDIAPAPLPVKGQAMTAQAMKRSSV